MEAMKFIATELLGFVTDYSVIDFGHVVAVEQATVVRYGTLKPRSFESFKEYAASPLCWLALLKQRKQWLAGTRPKVQAKYLRAGTPFGPGPLLDEGVFLSAAFAFAAHDKETGIIYAVFWSTATGSIPLSPWRANFGCGLVYSCVLGCVFFSQWQEREDFLARRELLIKAQTILAIVYPHLGFASFFSVCFFSGYAWTTWRVCGSEALTFWFFLHLSYQVVMAVLFAIVTETTHRERILAFVNSQDADSLVSAFRQMLKLGHTWKEGASVGGCGVCDGDLLLDGGLKICGGSGCLKRLLEMPEDVTGRAFADLIVENKEDIKTFDEFVRNSSQAARNEETAPQCLRVKAARRRVNVDVFHVALPKAIGLSSGAHLLALAEDADSRIQFEAESSAALEAEGDTIPESLLSGCHPAKRSAPSVTSMGSALTEQLEMFDELTQLTLLLNVSTELMDVAEVYMRFSRQTDEDMLQGPCYTHLEAQEQELTTSDVPDPGGVEELPPSSGRLREVHVHWSSTCWPARLGPPHTEQVQRGEAAHPGGPLRLGSGPRGVKSQLVKLRS
eukprot:s1850_g7.t1